MKITSRLFLDLLRSKGRRVTTVSYDASMPSDSSGGMFFDIPDHNSNPENLLMQAVLGEDMQHAVASLNEEQSLLVEMADLQKVPYRDIARAMGKPIGTIRSKLHRTHRQLQNSLEISARIKESASHRASDQDYRTSSRIISGSLKRSGPPRRAYSKAGGLAKDVVSVGDTI